ncbi:hypothetical protein C8Q69DRAFT_476143 [Paecilomyces variotii]|uniref:Uncharacterized protein n=1 Tax=Byssochlamys spectabilis TaxID=264951 RepID=A0A443HNP4_BYSSP|nr:hypothetical protein C8Q69DRAFT_476143 [Paecilomyces variotii]KAJ9352535.1 hypothetical protein DTO027B9_5774 [Paecilomyces variotii]KAJ9353978.1 hypothetical protein DTO280E4_7133 [Paecilomyces variotii]RWQ93391.1 hypothetical protein C8Q69DRAFT_476143 [Paecilomyces variotii]
MSLAPLSRGLTTSAASSAARLCRSSLSRSVASWNCSPNKLQLPRASSLHNALPPSPFLTRSFSSTPSIHSSLFRQTSDKTQFSNPSSPPEDQQQQPPHETHPQEDVEPEVYYSPYQPKRPWPPDMSKLSKKHQFRLERKYRRRAALKYARPKWTKATKLVQWGIIGFVLIYAILFMDWDPQDNPVEEVRKEFFSGMNSIFSHPQPPSPVHRAEDREKR